ncbi:hypothetical protein [Brachybacterium hainanense]|uniref:DUF4352 domain-containing protein n=1 Tax=Brachybacterium hainanense TaxID=1541174 RepID=A0ABV6R7E9_9MICO
MSEPRTGQSPAGEAPYAYDGAPPSTGTAPREAVMRPVPEEFPTPPPRPAGWNRRMPEPAGAEPLRRRSRRGLILALCMIGILICAIGTGAGFLVLRNLERSGSSAQDDPAASSSPARGELVLGGITVRDAALEQGVASVGDAGRQIVPEGEFAVLTVEIVNDSPQPVSLGASIRLIGEDGTTYEPDPEAGRAHLAESEAYGLADTGEAVRFHAVYDVPVGTVIRGADVDFSRYPGGGSGELPL